MGVTVNPGELAALRTLIEVHRGRIYSMAYLSGEGADGFLSAIDSGLIEKRRDAYKDLGEWGPHSLYLTPRGREAYDAARLQLEAVVPAPPRVAPPEPGVALQPVPEAVEGQVLTRVVTAEELAVRLSWKAVMFGDGRNGFYLQVQRCVEHPALIRTVEGSTRSNSGPPKITHTVEGEPVESTRTALAQALTASYARGPVELDPSGMPLPRQKALL